MINSLLIVAIANMFLFTFLLVHLSNKEDKIKENGELFEEQSSKMVFQNLLNTFLKVFYIFAIVISLYTTAHLSLIHSQDCQMMIVNETINGNTTSYNHDLICQPGPQKNIYTSYFKFINYLMWVLMFYLVIQLLVMIYKGGQELLKVIKKM